MNDLITVIKYIIQDMTEPAGYLPFGVAAGVVFLLFRKVIKRNMPSPTGRQNCGRIFSFFSSCSTLPCF